MQVHRDRRRDDVRATNDAVPPKAVAFQAHLEASPSLVGPLGPPPLPLLAKQAQDAIPAIDLYEFRP